MVKFIPQRDGESHPFFNANSFTYRITYHVSNRKVRIIEYQSPHEIMLNLKSFKPKDKITYVDHETREDIFTITVRRFNLMIAESMMNASPSDLELLYGRLLLTNTFSKSISDRGQLKYYNQILKTYLLTLRGGIDCYLNYDNRKVHLYLKCRRQSIHHLTTIISTKMNEFDIQIYHINIPSTMQNWGLLLELLNLEIPRSKIRMYTYDPLPEDNIIPTDISREITQVINQLIN